MRGAPKQGAPKNPCEINSSNDDNTNNDTDNSNNNDDNNSLNSSKDDNDNNDNNNNNNDSINNYSFLTGPLPHLPRDGGGDGAAEEHPHVRVVHSHLRVEYRV